jgi:hypothetical protein
MTTKKILFLILLIQIQFQVFGQHPESNKEKIKVLNFATFHLSGSTDANSSPVNINNPEVKKEINKIVEELVKFNPTIICVEVPVEFSKGTNEIYQKYKTDQSKTTNWSEEINSIAFEVGRLSGVENIYGIDSPLGFNYPKLMEMAKESKSISTYLANYDKETKKFNKAGIQEKFQILNSDQFKSGIIDFYNTLALMHTPGNYEGAEIISNFYKRNLMIYSNFYDVPKTKGDRIFIISGGTHTAYLDLFLKGHPNIELVDPEEYLVE